MFQQLYKPTLQNNNNNNNYCYYYNVPYPHPKLLNVQWVGKVDGVARHQRTRKLTITSIGVLARQRHSYP